MLSTEASVAGEVGRVPVRGAGQIVQSLLGQSDNRGFTE